MFARRDYIRDYMMIPPGTGEAAVVNVIVEIPKGRRNKFEVDKVTGLIKLDRYLYSSAVYPGDYGFIPQTLAEDGDPLDILVLGDAPTFPGCVYHARVIGLFEMLDQGIRDEKVIAYATGNARFADIQNYTEVQPHIMLEIAHFFSIYKDLEGKRTEALGWKSRETAYEVIDTAHSRYLKKHAAA